MTSGCGGDVPGVCTGVDNGLLVDGEVSRVVLLLGDLRTTGVVPMVVDLCRCLGGLRLSLLTGGGLEVLVDGRLFMKIWRLRSVGVATCATVGL